MIRLGVFFCLLVVSSVVCRSASDIDDKGSARLNNDEGIRLASDRKLSKAIKYFELAVEQEPHVPEWTNNLGVTMMRMGRLEEAKTQFERVLAMRPDFAQAIANLKELKEFSPKLFANSPEPASPPPIQPAPAPAPASSPTSGKRWESKNRNHRKPVPRLHLDDLFEPKYKQYALGRLPFVLMSNMRRWNATRKWTLDWLSKNYANSIVDFYPHNMAYVNVHPYLAPMHEAIREFIQPSAAYPRDPKFPGTYIQWNIDLPDWTRLSRDMGTLPPSFRFDDVWLEECFPDPKIRNEFSKRTHWRMMLIGTEGAGMFNHHDVMRTASWQAQVAGSKLWHLCAPSEQHNLYEAGAVDCFDPDYTKYPRFAQASCYEVEVHAGEMVYYPADYWHQTRNMATPSISVTSTMVDHNNWRLVRDELKDECATGKYRWGFSKELCQALPKCYAWWENHFEVLKKTAFDVGV
eukprot:TRINITY_DN8208_c0_g1_i1.p1 TRINITY_DN8208_c0_g1~~TRINITY_DN8208_c0_g1_i1.p1  ORF type:complete len:463 (+),score=120.37 TRINITY_DN8208_c0_g1_i1:80-1468(+)